MNNKYDKVKNVMKIVNRLIDIFLRISGVFSLLYFYNMNYYINAIVQLIVIYMFIDMVMTITMSIIKH